MPMLQWLYITRITVTSKTEKPWIEKNKESAETLLRAEDSAKSARRKAFKNSSNYRCPVVMTEINFWLFVYGSCPHRLPRRAKASHVSSRRRRVGGDPSYSMVFDANFRFRLRRDALRRYQAAGRAWMDSDGAPVGGAAPKVACVPSLHRLCSNCRQDLG